MYSEPNTCVSCGAVIPQGRMVCPACQHGGGEQPVKKCNWLAVAFVVIVGIFVVFGACALSYRFGVTQAQYKANFEDWQIELDAQHGMAFVQTDYGLIWAYEFDPEYLEECFDGVF